MQEKELVYLERFDSLNRGIFFYLMLDGFVITTFPLEEEIRARSAASNLYLAIYHKAVRLDDIKVIDKVSILK